MQDTARHDDVPGTGNEFVDVCDVNGKFISRFASGGVRNSPWGLAVAPVGFGTLGGDILVGNFGDGTISVLDSNGLLVGTLATSTHA